MIRPAPARLKAKDSRHVKPAAKVAAPIYHTPEYRAWQAAVIRRSGGLCQDPLHDAGRPRRTRLVADHIRELRDGGAPFDIANGMARCWPCHTRKTLAERARRMQG